MLEPLKLYYWPGACSLASHIALEETEANYEPVLVAFDKNEQRSASYLKINPKGRVPVLACGSFVLTENPAILRFIALAHPEADLWPVGLENDARCAEWLAWLSSTVHAIYSHVTRPERYADGADAQAAVREKAREATAVLWMSIEDKLEKGRWAIGDRYSVVDPYLATIWTWARGSKILASLETDTPNWTNHAHRTAERPAVRRIFQREGLALPGAPCQPD
jgi:glutathione S-transferase